MKLTVQNGTFSYRRGAEPIFRDVNFSVDSGEILAILGPNGAGKTTLLRCVTGMLRWTAGESLLDGEPIRTMPEKKPLMLLHTLVHVDRIALTAPVIVALIPLTIG